MDGGSEVVEALSAVNDLRTHPYRAYVVWSLGSIAEWARIWHDVAQVSPSPSIRERFRCERATQAALADALIVVAWGLDDADPEVRSMAYRLYGAGGTSPAVPEALIQRADEETHEFAKAFLVRAVLEWTLRHPDSVQSAEYASWVRLQVGAGGPALAAKVLAVRSAAHISATQRARATELLGAVPTPGMGPMWPSDSLG